MRMNMNELSENSQKESTLDTGNHFRTEKTPARTGPVIFVFGRIMFYRNSFH